MEAACLYRSYLERLPGAEMSVYMALCKAIRGLGKTLDFTEQQVELDIEWATAQLRLEK